MAFEDSDRVFWWPKVADTVIEAKKPEHYLAFLHFACALIAFRAAGLFG
jgi:hypothetical protein